MKLLGRCSVFAGGFLIALLLGGCQDEPTAIPSRKSPPHALVHASIMSTRIGNAIDIGSFGFGSAGILSMSNSGDIAGTAAIDATNAQDPWFWSPAGGLVDMGLPRSCTDAFANG
ncbi:MAG: hypothetical protein ACREOJ_05485, partial [Gemmatimonadaceae bacterium]